MLRGKGQQTSEGKEGGAAEGGLIGVSVVAKRRVRVYWRCRQWGPANAERPSLWIPVSCLLSAVSGGLLNRGHVLGRHLSCNYSTRIRF